jgi:hypothetical protein
MLCAAFDLDRFACRVMLSGMRTFQTPEEAVAVRRPGQAITTAEVLKDKDSRLNVVWVDRVEGQWIWFVDGLAGRAVDDADRARHQAWFLVKKEWLLQGDEDDD